VKQRNFPWLSSVPKPRDADLHHVGMCKTFSDAIAVSLHLSGDAITAARVANHLGVSSAFLSQLKKGTKKSVPKWLIEPFCWATGTNLLKQFFELEDAKAFLKRQKTPREQISAIVYSMKKAA